MSEKAISLNNLARYKQNSDNLYAKQDGYYFGLGSGTADNLTPYGESSGVPQHVPFVFQTTAGGSDVGALCQLKSLRGQSYVLNQLVDSETSSVNTILGHKYLTDISDVISIITGDGTDLSVSGGTDQVIDLTLMFVAGKEPSTVVEFNRLFPLSYYSYSAGQLVSCQASKLTTIGYNAYDNSNPNDYIRVIAGQTYTLEGSGTVALYDYDKNLLSDTFVSEGALPNNCGFVKITGGDNTTCFHLTLDGSRTGYEEYVKNEYPLPNVELRSVGDVYDEIKPDGTLIRRIGINTNIADLISAQSVSELGVIQFSVSSLGIKANTSYINIPNLICSRYITATYSDVYNANVKNSIGFVNDTLCIQDDNFIGKTTAQIKTLLTNVAIQFELATPTTMQVVSFSSNVKVDDFGTMEFDSDYPQGNDFFYYVDYKAFIDSLGGRADIGYDASQILSKSESLIPSATNTYDIGSSSYTIKDIYLSGAFNKNSSGYGLTLPSTTGLTANSELLDTVSNQTISGAKTLSEGLIIDNNTKIYKDSSNRLAFYVNGEIRWLVLADGTLRPYNSYSNDIGTSTSKLRNIYLQGSLSDGTNKVSVAEIFKKPSTSYSLTDGGTISDDTLKSLIQNEQPIKLNGFTCYFSCDDGTNYQYVSTRYDANANKNHINVITINKSTWVATFHTSDLALS